VLLEAAARAVFSLVLAVVAALVALRFLPRLLFGRQLILDTGLAAAAGWAGGEGDRRWLGRQGTAASPLRPAGIAIIEGERVDVVSLGDYIEAGKAVEVVRVEGNRVVVRRAPAATGKE
jgi:membrane-bound serine protease (ClpP class)